MQRVPHAKNKPPRLKTVTYSFWKRKYDLHRKPEVLFKLDQKQEKESVKFDAKTTGGPGMCSTEQTRL